MSQENVNLLRRSNDAFRRGDWDAWSANFDPDVLIRTDPEWPEQRIYGRDAVVDWARNIDGVLGTNVRVEEIRDLGDRVLARVRWEGSGQESGITGEIAWTELVTVRDGRIVFIEMFFDHNRALEAVGLEETVSQENVEIVRGIYDAVAKREPEAAFAVYDEDIVWDASNWPAAPLIMKSIYHGHEGVRQFWRESLSAFAEIDLDVEELIDAGSDVVAVIRERDIGRSSDAPVQARHAAVWTLANGKVIRLQILSDRFQALKAVGLEG